MTGFASGQRIETDQGLVPVEALRPGMMVRTLHNGFCAVKAVLSTPISQAALAMSPDKCPVTLPAVCGFRPLSVAGDHHMMLEGWAVELIVGQSEGLARARRLQDPDPIQDWFQTGVTYVHIILENHQILCVEGQWSGSHFITVDDEVLLDDAWARVNRNLPALPEFELHSSTALMCLSAFETKAVLNYLGRSPAQVFVDPVGHTDAQRLQA
ncbi:Hint domain-containing protein [Algirhabdus cladophorae]|uniref:Hint domain-containing protein n=1 Tax=Algirhabdus cladophorae TaxID=3377108 RepID=UPI003B84637F